MEDHVNIQGEEAIGKLGREASEETNLANTLISSSSRQNYEKINISCVSQPVCGILL